MKINIDDFEPKLEIKDIQKVEQTLYYLILEECKYMSCQNNFTFYPETYEKYKDSIDKLIPDIINDMFYQAGKNSEVNS